jgi:hypothetical protein
MGQPAKLGLCARFNQETAQCPVLDIFRVCWCWLLVLVLDGGELMGRWHHFEKEPTNMVQIRTYSKLGLGWAELGLGSASMLLCSLSLHQQQRLRRVLSS